MLPPPRSLYLHVPFCPKICPYCDFHKMHRHEGLVAQYLNRLEQEAQTLHAEFGGNLDTIYFGGGTPSHLSDGELARLVKLFENTWGWAGRLETTLEADPLTFDKARLETFKTLGFSRLSIGLQSTQDKVLKFLGRLHTSSEGLIAVTTALDAGFDVSADLITAIDEQDTAADLHTLARTGVAHISVYNLTVEPYTPFALRGVEVDEDKEARDFEITDEILSGYGFNRYEVSSHAKAGHESKHNQAYWHGDYFLNLGPSAAGFVPVKGSSQAFLIGERRTNPPIKTWLLGAPADSDKIDAESYVLDALMTGLRTARGVNLAELESRSNISVGERYAGLVKDLVQAGLLRLGDTHLSATAAGLAQLNGIVRRFWQG